MTTPSTGRDLHIDVPLSNIVVNRRPTGFIADQLLPITPVDKRSNLYYKFYHGLHRRWEENRTQRAPGTAAKQVGYAVTSDAYYADNFALGAMWPVEDDANADAVLNWAQANANNVVDQLMTDYEMRLARIAVNTSNVGTVTTIASAWSGAAATPYRDILDNKENYRQRTGMMPNVMILPEPVIAQLKTNAQIRDLLFGDRGGVPTLAQLSGLFDLDVLAPASMVNTFSDEATLLGSFSYSNIWGPNVYMAHVKTLAGMETDTWMNAFRWTNPAFGVPMAVRRFPYDAKHGKYELDVSYYQVEKVVSPDLAVRIMNVIST